MVNFREKLIEYPILGALIVMLSHGAFFLLAIVISGLIGSGLPYLYQLTVSFITIQIIFIVFFLIIIPFGYGLPNGKESFNDWTESIELKPIKPIQWNLFIGCITFGIIVLSLFLFTILFGPFNSDINILIGAPEPGYRKSAPHTYQLSKNNTFDWIGAFSNGIWEELLYRGIILHLFLKKYSKHKSVTLSSVLFGLSHSINLLFGADLVATLIQIVFTTILGMMWGYMTIYSKSLIPAIICHYLADSPLSIYVFYGAVQASMPSLFIGIIIFIVGLAFVPLVVNTYITKKIMEYKKSF